MGSCTFDGTNLSVTLNPTSGVLDEYDYYGPGGITEASPTTPLAGASATTPGYAVGYLQSEKVLDGNDQFEHRPPTRSIPVRIMPTPDRSTAIRRRFTPRPRQRPTAWPTIPPTASDDHLQLHVLHQHLAAAGDRHDGADRHRAQNGSGVAATTADYYDATGNPTWLRDGRGVLTAYGYDPITGAVTEEIDDVNTADSNPGVSPVPLTNGVP